MPPTDQTPASTIRHLSRLLAALSEHTDWELRIKQSKLNELGGEGGDRALFESFDSQTREVVLTFRPKSLATYLIEEPPSATIQPNPTASAPSLASSGPRLPWSDAQLAKLEARLAKERYLRTIKQPPQPSSNPLDGNL